MTWEPGLYKAKIGLAILGIFGCLYLIQVLRYNAVCSLMRKKCQGSHSNLPQKSIEHPARAATEEKSEHHE
jgi:hypothetical protein